MASFSSDLFSFDLQMRWTTPVIAAAAVLLVSLLSQWPGLRAIGRLDVATVVRERSL
jgi:putative ABC transport system permease protein